jgi:hypothetical protein
MERNEFLNPYMKTGVSTGPCGNVMMLARALLCVARILNCKALECELVSVGAFTVIGGMCES